MPALFALYIINKSVCLIYNKVGGNCLIRPAQVTWLTGIGFLQEFLPMAGLNLNDTLRLASIW